MGGATSRDMEFARIMKTELKLDNRLLGPGAPSQEIGAGSWERKVAGWTSMAGDLRSE